MGAIAVLTIMLGASESLAGGETSCAKPKADRHRAEPIALESPIANQSAALRTAEKELCESKEQRRYMKLKRDHKALGSLQGAGLLDRLSSGEDVDKSTLPSREDLSSANPQRRGDATRRLEQIRQGVLENLDKQRQEQKEALRKKADTAVRHAGGAGCDMDCVDEALQSCDDEESAGSLLENELLKRLDAPRAAAVTGGGLAWQTEFVNGLAKFLSDRAQAELVLWLVSELQSKICATSDGEAWFPETCTLLDPTCGYAEQSAGAVFSAAIRADIEALPMRVLESQLKFDPSVASVIVGLFTGMREGSSPLELLAGMSNDASLQTACASGEPRAQVACSLILVGTAVRYSGDACGANFEELIEPAANAVVGALNSYADQCLDKHMTAPAKHQICVRLDAARDLPKVKRLLRAVAELNQKLKRVRESSAPAIERAVELMIGMKSTLDAAVMLLPADSALVLKWPPVRSAVDSTAALLTGRYADGVRLLIATIRDYAEADKRRLPQPVARYLTLIVDLGEAKTAGEVQAALDAAAAPIGSWRAKRKAFTASVTGLVGFTGGYELPLDTGSGTRVGSGAGGVLGAVGMDFAFPCGTWTHGPFLSLLDVGQLITTPIDPQPGEPEANKNTARAKASTDIELLQVLSPGVYYRLGLGETPLTFGVGASIAPLLRLYETIDATGRTVDQDVFSMLRLNAFIAVDVTVLPIFRD